MTDFQIITILLICIHFFVFVYTFRFQRTTLSLSREHLGNGRSDYQAILSPTWMGILGWLQTILYVAVVIMIFLSFGWLYALIYVILSQIGYSLFDAITPFPSYEHCFKIIKGHLVSQIHSTQDEEAKGALQQVLEKVITSEKQLKN